MEKVGEGANGGGVRAGTAGCKAGGQSAVCGAVVSVAAW